MAHYINEDRVCGVTQGRRNDEAFTTMWNRLCAERDNADRAYRAMERLTRRLGFDPDYLPGVAHGESLEAYEDSEITDDPRKMLKAVLDAFASAAGSMDYALQQIDNRELFRSLDSATSGGTRRAIERSATFRH